MTSKNLAPGLLRDEHAELLDVTDGLRDIGLESHMPLPQLVVCGDQSSGKSSVLQSISGVKFPVNDGLCTRFATQVVLRRSEKKSGTVRIEPGSSASQELRQKLKAFNAVDADFEKIPTYMEDAKAVMDLAGTGSFSDATLRVELSGPNQPHLTLIDLPALIHARDKSQSEEDVMIARKLVQKYMDQERTIVLAILSAKSDPGTQEILEMVEKHDSAGSRTLGIITKPDVLHFGSPTEQRVLSYARNEQTCFGLGWHMVRNADYVEYSDPTYDRQSKEHELFSKAPWNRLPDTSLGAEALIARLGECSLNLTRTELPKVVWDIEYEIARCRSSLDTLGHARDSVGGQRLYLIKIAEKFQRVVLDGVEGQIGRNTYSAEPSRRLYAEVRRLTDAFADSIRRHGRTYKTPEDGTLASCPIVLAQDQTVPADTLTYDQPEAIESDDYLRIIYSQILEVNRGRELQTTFDPLLVRDVFRRQSSKWEGIAMGYADKAFFTAKSFVAELLKQNTDKHTYDKLFEEIVEPAMSFKQDVLHGKVKELLTPYTRSHPFSKNPRFLEELEAIELKIHKEYPTWEDREHSAAIYACRKLAYWERAYYKIALDTFVDNMATLAIENCILADLHEMFSPSNIAAMDDDVLERLASESPKTIEDRASAKMKLATFEKALVICRGCWIGRARHVRSRSVNPPNAATSQVLSPVPQHPWVGEVAEVVTKMSLNPPALGQRAHDHAGQIKDDHQARPGSSASMASHISARGVRHSYTRTPSPTHSPNASLSPAYSAASVSSPASSPQPGNGERKASKIQVKEE